MTRVWLVRVPTPAIEVTDMGDESVGEFHAEQIVAFTSQAAARRSGFLNPLPVLLLDRPVGFDRADAFGGVTGVVDMLPQRDTIPS